MYTYGNITYLFPDIPMIQFDAWFLLPLQGAEITEFAIMVAMGPEKMKDGQFSWHFSWEISGTSGKNTSETG